MVKSAGDCDGFLWRWRYLGFLPVSLNAVSTRRPIGRCAVMVINQNTQNEFVITTLGYRKTCEDWHK